MVLGRLPLPPCSCARQFIAAGDALAEALEPAQPPCPEARRLAEAMSDTLRGVHVTDVADADARIQLAISATLMSFVVPDARRVAEAVITEWLGVGVGGPARMGDPTALAGRTLLALHHSDADDATGCINRLFEASPDFPGLGTLQDLGVARVQGHGRARELECLEHLALLWRHEPVLRALVAACVASPPVTRRHSLPLHTAWPEPQPWPT